MHPYGSLRNAVFRCETKGYEGRPKGSLSVPINLGGSRIGTSL
jgi:hypothetical protein